MMCWMVCWISGTACRSATFRVAQCGVLQGMKIFSVASGCVLVRKTPWFVSFGSVGEGCVTMFVCVRVRLVWFMRATHDVIPAVEVG